MTAGGSHPLGLPPWLVGQGLLLPPILLPLVFCTFPRPVAPPLAVPYLDPHVAGRHLQSVGARASRLELSPADRALVRTWKRSLGWGTPSARASADANVTQAVSENFRELCRRVGATAGIEHVLAVGDVASLQLTRAAIEREVAPGSDEIPFFAMASRTGLLDGRGRLREHPLLVLALAQASWRERCGLQRELEMAPVELDALDVFLIRFGPRLDARHPEGDRFLDERLRSLERYAVRHPEYPSVPARAAVLLASGDRGGAVAVLQGSLDARPWDRALRNYLLFATSGER